MTLKMIDSEENGKLVESIYKNILDKFEPGARQLITAGKAYLKALQGTSTAAKQYMEAVSRLAKQAQQGTWDATSDIGSTLLQFTDVYREIQQQHHHILKAFYVDVLVPLETNLEKDTKVIQTEQKKFQQQLRLRQDNYQKAIGVVKKQRKKTRTSRSSSNLEKELKNMQCLEDEKAKLDGFCEESLRNALTQERIRYGFVLERQCSLAKHHLAYHAKGEKLLQRHLDEWHEVAKTRDFLPEHIQVMFGNGERPPPPPSSSLSNGLYGIQPMIPNGHLDHNLEDFFNDEHEDTLSMTLRKARSMDASSMDLRSLSEAIDPPDMVNGPPGSMVATSTMTRAKSDFNLSSSHQSLIAKETPRPRSMMVPNDDGSSSTTTSTTTTVVTSNNNRKKRPLSRALYSYLSSGEHQLSFHEGDSIAIVGERNKGWQYGENLRTRRSGWFPVAYTQMVTDDENEDDHTPTTSPRKQRALITSSTFVTPSMSFDPFSLHYPQPNRTISTSTSWSSQPNQTSKKMNWGTVSGEGFSRRDLGPPPPPPPPMPPGHTSSTISSYRHPHNHDTLSSLISNHSSYSPEPELRGIHRSLTSPAPLRGVVANNSIIHSGNNHNSSNMAATSLHSSNDSGFCNEINLSGPQQPEPDYVCDSTSPKELPNRENVFSTVKLRKTKTNDRSAPKIS